MDDIDRFLAEAERARCGLPPDPSLWRGRSLQCGMQIERMLAPLRQAVMDSMICDLIEEAEGWTGPTNPPARW